MKHLCLLFSCLLSISLSSQVVVANFSANPTVLCPGQTVQFTDLSTGNPTTWNWAFPGGAPATSTLQNPTVTYNSPGNYNVSLSASNGGLPGVNTTFNYITVNSTPPSAGSISGPSTVCQGQPATYTIAPVSTAVSYSWTAGTATILSGQGTTSVTLLTNPGITTLCVSAGNACGYGPSSCRLVTTLASPPVTVTPVSSTICSGSSVTFTASGGLTYTWSPTAGLSATNGPVVTASPSVNTVYTVTGSSALGCTRSVTTSVSILSAPVVIVNPSSTVICSGGSVQLAAAGALSYSWTPSAGLSSTSGAMVVASPSANTIYTVTGAGTNGCTNKATATVNVTGTPPGSPGIISGSPLACAGLSGTYSIIPVVNASTYSWTVPTGAVVQSGQGTTSVSVLFGTQGGSICVRASNGCGYGGYSCILILPLAQPTVTVTPSNVALCDGNSATLTAGGASSYTWSPPAGLSSANGATVVATPTAAVIYTVTGTGSTGCTGTAYASVTVNPLPKISIIPNAPSICGTGSVMLTASGGATYSWSPSSGLSSTTGQTVAANPTVSTSYTVAGTSTNGCTSSASVVVTVTSTPPSSVTAISGPSIICSAVTDTWSAAPVANASSYSWTVPAGASILSGQGTTLITVQAGTASGNICVSAVNACGASASACKSIFVAPSPTVTVSPASATICAGNFITLTASGANSYSWSPSTAVSSTTMQTIVSGPPATTFFSVTGTSTNGCSSTASATVTVMQLPTVTASPQNADICSGSSVTLTAGGALSYTWNPTNGLTANTGSMVVASPTLSIEYTVAGQDANGCVNYAVAGITVNTTPPANPGSVSGVTFVCESSSQVYSISPVAAASSYSWTVPSSAVLLAAQGSPQMTILTGISGGNICVTAMNGCGSSSPSCLTLSVSPLPVLVVSGQGTLCAGSSTTLTASGAVTYSWMPAAGLSTTTGATVSTSPASSVTYSVEGTSNDGCVSTQTVSIDVRNVPAPPSIIGNSSFCSGKTIVFTVTPDPAVQYSWTVMPLLQMVASGNNTAMVSGTASGSICVQAINGCGTGSQTCNAVTVIQLPSLFITAPFGTSFSCNNKPIQLIAASGATNAAFSWQQPNISLPVYTVSITPQTGGTYTAQVTDNTSGCSNSASIEVDYHTTAPVFGASLQQPECTELGSQPAKITLTVTEATQRYYLVQGNAITGTTEYTMGSLTPADHLIKTVPNPGQDLPYVLRVIDEGGCFRDTLFIVKRNDCEGDLFIPEAFTPDGDQKNDRFIIDGLDMSDNNLTVFNRWGNEVFSKAPYDNSWDGTSNGSKLPPGTYYYVLEMKNSGLKTRTGFIVIQY
jgi:gliding motility-associated-like protein